MEILNKEDAVRLSNPGVVSEQLLSPHNSSSARVTITRVTMHPGTTQPRHKHDRSEQIWIALSGQGQLLLADGAMRAFRAGQIARFEEGDVHGFKNDGDSPFIYMSVTSPPINFDYAYRDKPR
jgi:quercetin dioxygenase-like cupin family protein